ncbi:P4 [Soybean chlorotic leafroll virus]|uniref:P4 n=1 Tax=Soybean chlorotic leafroll virus TaxID=2959664 RepID=A0AAE9SBI9_9VIRU|nr:P4 [Soybean chlorotic leafroll virus]
MGNAEDVLIKFQDVGEWLWSKPLGYHDDQEDNDETADALIEEAELEEGQAKHLYYQRTISRAVPPEVSPSGRLYQRSQNSVMEYSRPSMSIKSQWSSWSSSPRPLPLPQAPSLTSWTPIANTAPSNRQLTSSESPRVAREHGELKRLTGRNGMTRPKTNSGYFSKEMVLAPPSREPSGSPLSVSSKTRNR